MVERAPARRRERAPAPSRVDFDFPRFSELMDSWRNNVSDHCPVKVCLKL